MIRGILVGVGLVVAGGLVAGAFAARPAARSDPVTALGAEPPLFVPPPPFGAAPVPWIQPMRVPGHRGPWLPPPESGTKARPLSATPQGPLRVRPAADLPPVASDVGRPALGRPMLPVGPRAWAPSQDTDAIAVRMGAGYPDPNHPTIATDPVMEAGQALVLAAAIPLREGAVPMLRLAIPDPFELVAPLAFHHWPPDEDPPASARSLALRPKLPAVPQGRTPSTTAPGNLALASAGAVATADSESERHSASRVIDGTIASDTDYGNRWQSAGSAPPHWVQVKLARPARIGRIVIRFADPACHPVDFRGFVVPEGGREMQEVFRTTGYENARMYRKRLEPVMTDTFRLVIEKSISPESPNVAQISEIELYPPQEAREERPAPRPAEEGGRR